MGHELGHRKALWALGSSHCWSMWDGQWEHIQGCAVGVGALGSPEVQHRVGTDLKAQTQVPLVPPTCRNSREESKAGFLLIALEGRLLVHSDFLGAQSTGTDQRLQLCREKYTALKNNPPLERLQHCNKILMFKDIPS